ncbi:MAG TPA: hypothetical protein VIQ24_03430 [Pyrinomonadaceae bacterium]
MASRIARNAQKGLAVCLLMCSLMICAYAQTSTLTFKNNKATVHKILQPRRESDAHFYLLKLRKGQMVDVRVDAGGVFLSKENECSVFFELFDEQGEAVFIGDDMVGIDKWKGEIGKTGNYKIKVAMNCLEGFTASQLRKKKPTFKYSLNVHLK